MSQNHFNWKNRPKTSDKKYQTHHGFHIHYNRDLDTWLEGFEKKVRQGPSERKIKLWLVNTEDLPLLLRVQTILGLYRKEILGDE